MGKVAVGVGGGRTGVIAVGVRGLRRWHIESPSTEFELVGAMAVGEQAVVTDAMEAGWEDVEQEAAHELADLEAHELAALMAVLAIVLPAETDMGRVEIEQTAVGDRDAMRIAREIGQDLLRTGEGLFGIDDPFALAQRREVSSPRVGVFKLAEIGEELQFGGGVHGFETSTGPTISAASAIACGAGASSASNCRWMAIQTRSNFKPLITLRCVARSPARRSPRVPHAAAPGRARGQSGGISARHSCTRTAAQA